jgi:hypothetical protein
MEGNEDIFEIMNDPAFRGLTSEQLVREGYDRLRPEGRLKARSFATL